MPIGYILVLTYMTGLPISPTIHAGYWADPATVAFQIGSPTLFPTLASCEEQKAYADADDVKTVAHSCVPIYDLKRQPKIGPVDQLICAKQGAVQ